MRVNLACINPVITIFNACDTAYIGADEDLWLTVSRLLLDKKVFILMPNQHSVFMFRPIMPGVYETHVAVSPVGRKNAIPAGQDAFYWMVKNSDCKKILAMTDKRAVALYARKTGMLPIHGAPEGVYMFFATNHMVEEVMRCRQ